MIPSYQRPGLGQIALKTSSSSRTRHGRDQVRDAASRSFLRSNVEVPRDSMARRLDWAAAREEHCFAARMKLQLSLCWGANCVQGATTDSDSPKLRAHAAGNADLSISLNLSLCLSERLSNLCLCLSLSLLSLSIPSSFASYWELQARGLNHPPLICATNPPTYQEAVEPKERGSDQTLGLQSERAHGSTPHLHHPKVLNPTPSKRNDQADQQLEKPKFGKGEEEERKCGSITLRVAVRGFGSGHDLPPSPGVEEQLGDKFGERRERGNYAEGNFAYAPPFGIPASTRMLQFPCALGRAVEEDVHRPLTQWCHRLQLSASAAAAASNNRHSGKQPVTAAGKQPTTGAATKLSPSSTTAPPINSLRPEHHLQLAYLSQTPASPASSTTWPWPPPPYAVGPLPLRRSPTAGDQLASATFLVVVVPTMTSDWPVMWIQAHTW
nr:unnamed protein product [Digitaria exilis]